MDPNYQLEYLRQWAKDALLNEPLGSKSREAAHGFQALDEWLSKGGFPPDDWKHNA